MAVLPKSQVEIALEAFSKNLAARTAYLEIRDDTALWHAMKTKRKVVVSQKTVNNAAKGRHDAKLSTLEAIAATVDVPLWVMLIPDLNRDFMENSAKDRLVKLVADYAHADGAGRGQIENAAALYADLNKKKK